jgi:DNA-directed RNA polymerase specialized sigma24 family protein
MSPADELRRGLTAAAFATLLERLGPDTDRAGAAYEELRRALVGFFTWRGAATPEECADETLDRLATRLEEGVAVEDVPRFTRGIARLVLLEHWRRPDAQRAPIEEVRALREGAAEDPGAAAVHECLEKCLAELAPEGRTLILDYYGAEGRARIDSRKRMAGALRLSESALRNRAQRLRDRLEQCISGCLGSSAAAPAAGPPTNRSNDTKA